MGKSRVPEIRFCGFTDDWEQQKLGNVAEVKDSARIPNIIWKNEGVPYLRSSDLATDQINGELFLSEEDYKTYAEKTGAPVKGDVLFASGGDIGFAYYKADDTPMYVQGGSILYVKTSESEKLKGQYLRYLFESPKVKTYIQGASTGTSLKHFVLKSAIALPISFPSKEEQIRIGDYFQILENTIILHKQELDLLKQMKQGFLQKMFPKDGETVPEIRFPGFNDDWEQCKLGSVIDLRSGRDYKHLQEGDIPVYGTGGYMLSVNEALSYQEDAIGIGRKGTIDKPYVLKAPFWTVDTLFYAVPAANNDLAFIFDIFQNINWKQKDESTGVPSLSKTAINEIDVLIPEYEEQKTIGKYFQNLDNLITFHQQKLDLLKQTKKAFLQKMFI